MAKKLLQSNNTLSINNEYYLSNDGTIDFLLYGILELYIYIVLTFKNYKVTKNFKKNYIKLKR